MFFLCTFDQLTMLAKEGLLDLHVQRPGKQHRPSHGFRLQSAQYLRDRETLCHRLDWVKCGAKERGSIGRVVT